MKVEVAFLGSQPLIINVLSLMVSVDIKPNQTKTTTTKEERPRYMFYDVLLRFTPFYLYTLTFVVSNCLLAHFSADCG